MVFLGGSCKGGSQEPAPARVDPRPKPSGGVPGHLLQVCVPEQSQRGRLGWMPDRSLLMNPQKRKPLYYVMYPGIWGPPDEAQYFQVPVKANKRLYSDAVQLIALSYSYSCLCSAALVW